MKYVPYSELCDIPQDILTFLTNKFDNVTKTRVPNIGTSKGYYQWAMHKEINDKEDNTYRPWLDDDMGIIDDFFKQYVNRVFRFRFSLLKAPYCIDWHTKHEYPRIHIPLNECDAVWELKESEDSPVQIMEPMVYGKAYLVDVTMLHRVVPNTTSVRRNAFFCFEELANLDLFFKHVQEV